MPVDRADVYDRDHSDDGDYDIAVRLPKLMTTMEA